MTYLEELGILYLQDKYKEKIHKTYSCPKCGKPIDYSPDYPGITRTHHFMCSNLSCDFSVREEIDLIK